MSFPVISAHREKGIDSSFYSLRVMINLSDAPISAWYRFDHVKVVRLVITLYENDDYIGIMDLDDGSSVFAYEVRNPHLQSLMDVLLGFAHGMLALEK